MSMQRIAGSVLIIGSVLFFIAAFSPIAQVFTEPDATQKMEIINNGGSAWIVDQIFFCLGSLVTGAGLALTVNQHRNIPGATWAFLGVAAIALGAVLWSWNVYQRTIAPQAFVTGTLPVWPFIAYTLLTQAGLVAIGILLLRSTLPGWVGWMLIGGSIFFFVAFIILKDMPPFVYYILTILTGIIIVWRDKFG
jgi:hypothetical protein